MSDAYRYTRKLVSWHTMSPFEMNLHPSVGYLPFPASCLFEYKYLRAFIFVGLYVWRECVTTQSISKYVLCLQSTFNITAHTYEIEL